MQIQRNALVRHSPERMFDLVNDIEAYPKRFTWCVDSRVIDRGEDTVTARLDLRLAGMTYSFTTRNQLSRPTRIELNLVEGPVQALHGVWQFLALAEQGCKVILTLDIDFSGTLGKLKAAAMKMAFQNLANKLVDDFCRQAELEAK